MTSRELMQKAMRREPTERIPSMPQIVFNVANRICGVEDGVGWIDGLCQCIERPILTYEHVLRLVRRLGCDGLRLFVLPRPMKVKRIEDGIIVLDPKTGNRMGTIDLHSGGYLPDKPLAPVETLEEAKSRLDEMIQAFDDETLEILRQTREQVPDLFVASWPGYMTMDCYRILRGNEQGLTDLHDRPEFVTAVMEMQVDAMTERAERLLTTGIDALYIGDASASASVISPKHFERFCFPAYQEFCSRFRERILIYLHICGNSRPILEMMADTGAHVIEPLDPLGGNSVADAKARVGKRVALMGGVNTLNLSRGTPEQLRTEAIQKCLEGGPHGYILAAGDQVPPETPLKNLRALVDVATSSRWRGPSGEVQGPAAWTPGSAVFAEETRSELPAGPYPEATASSN